MASLVFSNDELNFITDKTFFKKKDDVNSKVINQLNELHQKLIILLKDNNESVPESVLKSSPKISRGENYQGFPWLVLDYPRIFNTAGVFAFRTLFWWGHSWVLTFQLSGNLFQNFRSTILSNLNSINVVSCKIGIGNDPWIHNPHDSMYIQLKKFIASKNNSEEKIKSQPFFKLIREVEFSQSENLTEEAIAFYSSCLRLLKT